MSRLFSLALLTSLVVSMTGCSDPPPPTAPYFRPRIHACPIRRQAPAGRPLPERLNLVPRSDSHGHDVLGGLNERHVEQGREPTARLDLSPGPLGVIGPGLPGIEAVVQLVDAPDPVLLFTARQVHEEHTVEALGPGELRRQLRGVVAGADEKDVTLVVIEPSEQRAEHASGDAGVCLAGTRSPGESLLDFVTEEHAGRHRIGQPKRLPDIALRLTDERAQEIPDIENHRWPAGLVAQSLRELTLAAARGRQQQHSTGTLAGLGFSLATHGPQTERLQVLQAAELIEVLGASVQRDEPAFL